MKHMFLASAAVLALSQTLSASAQADTLKEALAAAYESNPDLEARRAQLRAVDESAAQAVSGFRPTVQGQASIGRSDTKNVTGSTPDNPDGSEVNFKSTDKNYSASVDQPIFRGFRTYNELKGANAEIRAERERLRDFEQTTMVDAVTAYMDVVRDEAVLELNQNQVEVLRRQLEASQDRFRVGEITRTDVAQSEARLAVAISGRINAEAQLTASREAYRRVIGRTPGTLEAPFFPQLPENEEEALSIAQEENPVLLAARENEEAARYDVAEAKGVLLPTIGARAEIRRNEGSTPGFDSATGAIIGIDRQSTTKSIGAQLTVPLYQSGAEYSSIRRAKQTRSQRMLEIAAAERQVVEIVHNAWEQYRAAQASIQSNRSSVRANEIALEGVRQEAAVGSRTTLDVLDAEQELLDARVNLVRAERNEVVAAFQLAAAIGRLSARQLNLDVEYYDPSENYQDVKWKFLGFDTNGPSRE